MKKVVITAIFALSISIIFFGESPKRHTNAFKEQVVNKRYKLPQIVKDTVVATIYNAEPSQCNDDCFTTAFMFHLDEVDQFQHRIIAVSRDLLEDYPNGTKVKISGTWYDGIYTVRDKMNKRFTNRIDLLINKDMKGNKWDEVIIEKID